MEETIPATFWARWPHPSPGGGLPSRKGGKTSSDKELADQMKKLQRQLTSLERRAAAKKRQVEEAAPPKNTEACILGDVSKFLDTPVHLLTYGRTNSAGIVTPFPSGTHAFAAKQTVEYINLLDQICELRERLKLLQAAAEVSND